MTGLLLLLAFALAWPATAGIRRAALRHELLDRPNARSSHTLPTPRGGGLAFVAVFVLLLPLVAQQPGGDRLALALAAGGLPVAAIGFLDDVRSLSARLRAGVHVGAATAAVLALRIPHDVADSVVIVLLVVGLVWLVNLYNFMDGIDGIAGSQAVVAAVALAAVGAQGALNRASWVLAGSVLGFLVLNAPPARIFMGDVGSGFLGLVLGVLVLHADTTGVAPLPVLGLVLTPFLVDATATLLVRVLRRERWYEPHRDHVYQRLVQAGMSHRAVTTAYALLSSLLAVQAVVVRSEPWAVSSAVASAAAVLALWVVVRLRTRGAVLAGG